MVMPHDPGIVKSARRGAARRAEELAALLERGLYNAVRTALTGTADRTRS
jgi:hypothetical protein